MNPIVEFIAYWIRFPAELKGMKFGKKSFIGMGYDFFFVQLKGITVGDYVQIGKNAWMQTVGIGKINVGDNTNIGRNFVCSAMKEITIGKNCLLSYNVSIFDHEHNTQRADVSPRESGISDPKPTIIEDECFIGAHSFILKGVHLGKHCVVGANSVVTDSFPALSKVAGSPAKLIGTIQSSNKEL